MTNTSIRDAGWRAFGEYEDIPYEKEGCKSRGLPLGYTIRKMIRPNDKIFHLLSFIASEGYWEEAIYNKASALDDTFAQTPC